MKLKLLVLGIALVATVPQIGSATPGFGTGSCAYPSGHALPGSGAVRTVGSPYASIQAAVNAAAPGDTVLIPNGTYNESVVVNNPEILIRGESRWGVKLDGANALNIGIQVRVDRVMVENLTAHNYRQHGVQWFNVTGFWGRYITAYDNGLYGVFAIGSRCGEFSHTYTSGNADSGIYIGECFPCDTIIHHVDSVENALGYSGTNAGGNLVLRDSRWNDNGMGIVPNSLDSEERPPQRGITIKNNEISENNSKTAPATGIQGSFWGVGIAIAGGQSNAIYGNTMIDNGIAGVIIAPIPSDNVYISSSNTVWGNTVTHDDAQWPSAYDLAQGASSGPNNCWADNTFGTSAPPALQDVWSCDVTAGTWVTPPGGDPRVEAKLVLDVAGAPEPLGDGRAPAPWQTWPAPTCAIVHAVAGVNVGPCIDAPSGYGDWLPALGLSA